MKDDHECVRTSAMRNAGTGIDSLGLPPRQSMSDHEEKYGAESQRHQLRAETRRRDPRTQSALSGGDKEVPQREVDGGEDVGGRSPCGGVGVEWGRDRYPVLLLVPSFWDPQDCLFGCRHSAPVSTPPCGMAKRRPPGAHRRLCIGNEIFVHEAPDGEAIAHVALARRKRSQRGSPFEDEAASLAKHPLPVAGKASAMRSPYACEVDSTTKQHPGLAWGGFGHDECPAGSRLCSFTKVSISMFISGALR